MGNGPHHPHVLGKAAVTGGFLGEGTWVPLDMSSGEEVVQHFKRCVCTWVLSQPWFQN